MDEDYNLLFLLSGSVNALPESYVKLRSYFNIQSANVAQQQNLKLPKCFNNRGVTCPYCYYPWNSATSSFKLLPAKKLTADEKRKIKSDKSRDETEIKEASLPKNNMILKCHLCGNKTSFSLIKKSKTSKVEVEVIETKVTKKKKKKDKSCGLKTSFITPVKEIKNHSTTPSINQKSKTSLNHSTTTKNPCQLSVKNSTNSFSKVSQDKNTNLQIVPVKKTVINPYAVLNQQKKNKKKLELLSQAAKEDKGSIRNTLKDFLTLVSR